MIELLSTALGRTSRITTLCVGANAIGSEALPALTAALTNNQTVTHLDVRSHDELSTPAVQGARRNPILDDP